MISSLCPVCTGWMLCIEHRPGWRKCVTCGHAHDEKELVRYAELMDNIKIKYKNRAKISKNAKALSKEELDGPRQSESKDTNYQNP